MSERTYNLKPSIEWADHTNQRASVNPLFAANLPAEYTFGESEPILDQLQLGSCTANMIAEIISYLQTMDNVPKFLISRLFQYYMERSLEGTVNYDSGASIADTIKAASFYGYIPETQKPYDITKFTVAPTQQMLNDAQLNKVKQASMLNPDIATLKAFLYSKTPVAYGFSVYQQYESVGSNGMIAMPYGGTLGGHANSFWGWSDSRQAWRVHNVWGPSWGDSGRAWLPYSYPIWDVWGVSLVSEPIPPSPTPVPPNPTPTPQPTPQPIPPSQLQPMQRLLKSLGIDINTIVDHTKATYMIGQSGVTPGNIMFEYKTGIAIYPKVELYAP